MARIQSRGPILPSPEPSLAGISTTGMSHRDVCCVESQKLSFTFVEKSRLALARQVGPCSKTTIQEILTDFLHEANFSMPAALDSKVRETQSDVAKYFESVLWPPDTIDHAMKRAPYVCDGVVRSFSFLERSALRDMSIFSTFLFLVDDLGWQMSEDLGNFAMDLMQHNFPSHPILRSHLEFLPTMRAHLGRFAMDMMFTATIQFFNGCLLEDRPAECFRIVPGAVDFPRYFRLKTGYAEPYAHFVFPESMYPEDKFLPMYQPIMPHLVDFINLTNDLMSFYKESILSDERSDYIYNLAKTKQMSIEECLLDTAAAALECVTIVREGLAEHPLLLETTESFIQGYLAFHITSPRYKLAELVDGRFYL